MTDTVLSEATYTILSEKPSEVVVINNITTADVVETVFETVVVSQEFAITVITEGTQGPAGPAGVVEEEMTYSKRIDFITDNLIYRGEAAVGALNSAPVWRIRKISVGTDDDISETWVNGNANFTNVWDDRLLGVYS